MYTVQKRNIETPGRVVKRLVKKKKTRATDILPENKYIDVFIHPSNDLAVLVL